MVQMPHLLEYERSYLIQTVGVAASNCDSILADSGIWINYCNPLVTSNKIRRFERSDIHGMVSQIGTSWEYPAGGERIPAVEGYDLKK
jgi:hypothetical protein